MDFMISPKRTGGNPTFSAVVGATTENPFEQKAEVAVLPQKLEPTPSVTQTADLIFKRHRQKEGPPENRLRRSLAPCLCSQEFLMPDSGEISI